MAAPLTARMLDHLARLQSELREMLEDLRDWRPPEDEQDAAALGARQRAVQTALQEISAEFQRLLAEWQRNASHDPKETLRISKGARQTDVLVKEVMAAIATADNTARAAMAEIQQELSTLRQGRGSIARYKSGATDSGGLNREA